MTILGEGGWVGDVSHLRIPEIQGNVMNFKLGILKHHEGVTLLMSPEFPSSRAVTIKFFAEIELISFKHLRAFK